VNLAGGWAVNQAEDRRNSPHGCRCQKRDPKRWENAGKEEQQHSRIQRGEKSFQFPDFPPTKQGGLS
jgi:hypothetical protein